MPKDGLPINGPEGKNYLSLTFAKRKATGIHPDLAGTFRRGGQNETMMVIPNGGPCGNNILSLGCAKNK